MRRQVSRYQDFTIGVCYENNNNMVSPVMIISRQMRIWSFMYLANNIQFDCFSLEALIVVFAVVMVYVAWLG
jgi:hypothetical protein